MEEAVLEGRNLKLPLTSSQFQKEETKGQRKSMENADSW